MACLRKELNPAPAVGAVAPPRWPPRACASADPCKIPGGPLAAVGGAGPSGIKTDSFVTSTCNLAERITPLLE